MDFTTRIREIITLDQYETEMEKAHGMFTPHKVPAIMRESDKLYCDLIDEYAQLPEAEKECIRKNISVKDAWFLYGFGIAMATYSLRFPEQRYFTNGLFALGIAHAVLDTRDIWLVLSLYWNTHEMNALSFDDVLKQNDGFTPVLKEYVEGGSASRSFETMGYVLEDTEDGPTYVRTW